MRKTKLGVLEMVFLKNENIYVDQNTQLKEHKNKNKKRDLKDTTTQETPPKK